MLFSFFVAICATNGYAYSSYHRYASKDQIEVFEDLNMEAFELVADTEIVATKGTHSVYHFLPVHAVKFDVPGYFVEIFKHRISYYFTSSYLKG